MLELIELVKHSASLVIGGLEPPDVDYAIARDLLKKEYGRQTRKSAEIFGKLKALPFVDRY